MFMTYNKCKSSLLRRARVEESFVIYGSIVSIAAKQVNEGCARTLACDYNLMDAWFN